MDIDFVVQDAFALIRPQWKLVTSLEEAGRAFAEAVKQNYRTPVDEPGKSVEADDGNESSESETEVDGELKPRNVPGAQSSGEEAEVWQKECP